MRTRDVWLEQTTLGPTCHEVSFQIGREASLSADCAKLDLLRELSDVDGWTDVGTR